MLNRVVLIGRLTRDSELRYTPNGIAVCNFTLAVDRPYKNAQGEKETDFIPVVVYRQLGEACSKYLGKGKMAAVDGRIQVRSFTGQDGQKRWVTEIIAEDVRFLSPKEPTAANMEGGERPFGGSTEGQPYGNLGTVSLDDDIPF